MYDDNICSIKKLFTIRLLTFNNLSSGARGSSLSKEAQTSLSPSPPPAHHPNQMLEPDAPQLALLDENLFADKCLHNKHLHFSIQLKNVVSYTQEKILIQRKEKGNKKM